jgi:hypothetical protein
VNTCVDSEKNTEMEYGNIEINLKEENRSVSNRYVKPNTWKELRTSCKHSAEHTESRDEGIPWFCYAEDYFPTKSFAFWINLKPYRII